MRRHLLVPSLLLALSGTAACGGNAPPVEVAPPTVATSTGTVQVAAETATSEPRFLLVLARWKAPLKGVDEIFRAFGSPVSIQALAGDEITKFIDTNASVDFAVALDPESTDEDPKIQIAFSLPLRDFEAARVEAEKEGPLTPVAGGALRVSGKEVKKLGACDLSPAVGDATARLVCGANHKDVDALRGWMTHGLAPQTGGNDLVVTARAGALRERYLPMLRTKGASYADQARDAIARQNVSDPELIGVPGIVLDEGLHFLEDVDGFDLKVSFTQTPPELISVGSLRFGGKTSWVTRLLTETNDKPGPPPALFWRAPHDAYTATWGRGSDPRAFDGIRRVLHKALATTLDRFPLPDADKGSLLALIDAAPRATGAWVSSQGILKSKTTAPEGAPIDVKTLASNALGWSVVGVEAPAAEYVAWAKQGVDTYGRMLRLAHDFLALAGRAGKDDPLRLAPKLVIHPSPAGWPKGTMAFDLTVNSELAEVLSPMVLKALKAPKGKLKGSVTVRLAIVPDGNRTWSGFSADLDELKKRMNAVISGAPDAGTLATREGLEQLRDGGQTWGGFVTFGDLFERVEKEIGEEKPSLKPAVKGALASLPNHGRTPVLIKGSGTGGDKPSVTAEWRVEGGSLEDVAAFVKYLVDQDAKSPKAAKP